MVLVRQIEQSRCLGSVSSNSATGISRPSVSSQLVGTGTALVLVGTSAEKDSILVRDTLGSSQQRLTDKFNLTKYR
jgi:hypothetical protein